MRTLHVVAPAGLVGGGLTALGGNVAHVLMSEADASLSARSHVCARRGSHQHPGCQHSHARQWYTSLLLARHCGDTRRRFEA